jgi:hypothetical protein
MSACFDMLRPMVDRTIEALGAVDFRDDPIAGHRYARATSIVSSAYKRHGKILELALLERLRENNRLSVWTEEAFKVSPAADGLVNTSSLGDCLASQLPYGEEYRSLQVDIVVYDNVDRAIRAYEVKRGNGDFDAGKVRSIKRDLLCTHVLLRSYGQGRGYDVSVAESKIIFYYGVRSIRPPLSLAGAELDDHFGFPVVAAVEQVNTYFRDRLHALLEAG